MFVRVFHVRVFHVRVFHVRVFHVRVFHVRVFHVRVFHVRVFHVCVFHVRIFLCVRVRVFQITQRDAKPRTYVNKLFCSENKQRFFTNIFSS